MFSLYFIGNFLEMLIGKRRFFWVYLLSGIFAGIFFSAFSFLFGNLWWGARIFGSSLEYALGASGAIFGVAGVLALLTPRNKVYLIAGPLIAIIIEAVIDQIVSSQAIINVISILITIYIFVAIFSLISFNFSLRKISLPIEMPFWILPIVAIVPLIIVGFFIRLPIGNMAHLGGFIAGACYGIYLRLRYKKKTQAIDNYFARR
jgi:membrane associated rhomboid family serine protease